MTNIDFIRSSVSDAQWNAFSGLLGAPDTNLNDSNINQYLTADLNDKQWGLNSTLSWSVGDGTIRLIDNYRDWKNNQLDGDVIFTPSQIVSRRGLFDSKSQNHELQFISPKDKWLNGRLDMVGGLYYFHEKYHQGERLNMNAQFCNVLFAGCPATNVRGDSDLYRRREQCCPGRLPDGRQLRGLCPGELPLHRSVLRHGRRPLLQGQEERRRTTRRRTRSWHRSAPLNC